MYCSTCSGALDQDFTGKLNNQAFDSEHNLQFLLNVNVTATGLMQQRITSQCFITETLSLMFWLQQLVWRIGVLFNTRQSVSFLFFVIQ